MKTKIFGLVLTILATSFFACKDDDNGAAPQPDGNLGTFAGSIQVSNDPVTQVGYLYDVKVTVTRNGPDATVKVAGDPDFNREYTGTVTGPVAGSYDIVLNRQTKPVEKIAGDRVIILNNKLTITLAVANDNVSAWNNPNKTQKLSISGKLQLIGTEMLKE